MSNTKLNQAILRVAKQNPEFRKALQAEMGKQASRRLQEMDKAHDMISSAVNRLQSDEDDWD